MKTINYFFKAILCCCFTVFLAMSSFAQCVNSDFWSSATAVNDGMSHVISTCNYLGEYSNFYGATIGDDYEFTIEDGGYVTVTDPSNNVLGHGPAPFIWTASTTNVRLHWNVDTGCGSESVCHDTGYTNISYEVPPAPENDLCEDALGLECGSVRSGTNIGATSTGQPSYCDTFISGGGVWYKFEGNGADISVSTCSPNTDFDTKLSVYEGVCGSMVCVAGDDDYPGCSSSSFQSMVEFSSEVGTIYYIYVAGFSGNEGNFDLTLTCKVDVEIAESCATVYDGYDPLACTDITATSTYGTPPYTYSWSNGDSGATINVCPTETTTYEVTVTDAAGNTDTAETTVVATDVSCGKKGDKVEICHITGNGSSHTICVSPKAVAAHLAHGDSLGACEDTYTCDTVPDCAIVSSPEHGATEQSIDSDISWSPAVGLVEGYIVSIGTTSGGTDIADHVDVGENLSYDPGTLDYLTTYYVSVTAYNGIGIAEACSESSFTTEESPWCSADLLECNAVKQGTSVDADIISTLGFCGTSFASAPGVWYAMVGTGDDITITTCSENTDYDTRVGVFSGDCNGLSCVAGDDDDYNCSESSLNSTVEFSSVPGELYYVYVTGYNSTSVGNFELTITCTEPPVPPCEDADSLYCGMSTTVSTVGVEGIDFDSTCFMSDYGKWFKLEGDGSTYNIAATTIGYDIEMAISSGVCGQSLTNITCRDGAVSTGTESYSLATVPGTVYYVYIAHWSGSSTTTGEFTLTVDCEAPFDGTVECGETVNTSYCYGSGGNTPLTYQSTDGSPLTVTFNSGNVENTYDSLIVLDSDGVTELYNGYGNSGDVSGLMFTSTGDALTVTVDSDASISCESSSSIDPIELSVSCAAQARSSESASVDINSNHALTWTMYPNPTKGEVQLDLTPLHVSSAQVDIYDYTGKVIRSISVNTERSSKVDVDLQGLAAGVYFVKVVSDKESTVKQLILN